MPDNPSNLKYTESHEWILDNGDGTITVGITDHAQEVLGDLVFIELPEIGRVVTSHEEVVVVESVKAAADVYAPVSGEITAVNNEVVATPELVNKDAYGAWLFKMKLKDAGELASLLDASAYQKSYS